MSYQPLNSTVSARIPVKPTTCLLLVDCQLGYRKAEKSNGASTPDFEQNVTKLLQAFRGAFAALPQEQRPVIIHVQHRSPWTDSPFYFEHVGPYGPNGEEKRGVDFLEFAAPLVNRPEGPTYLYTFDEIPPPKDEPPRPHQDELVMTCHGHSPFINTPLEYLLNKKEIKTLLIAGMPTDLAVSTAVRMAQNLALTGKWGGKGNMEDTAESALQTDGVGVYGKADESSDELTVDMPRIVLIKDATRAFGKGGIDAQTVQDVHIESLREFAEVMGTDDVVGAFKPQSS